MKNKISKHIFIKKKNYRYIILILALIITFTALYLYRLNADQIANSWVKNKVHITYENAAGKSVSIDSNIVRQNYQM